MKKLIIAAVMLLLMATGISGVAAQGDDFSPLNFNGLESGYGRLYAHAETPTTAAPAAAAPATASDDDATPEVPSDARVQVQTVTFDTEENATTFVEAYQEESNRMLADAPEGEMEVAEIDDLGENAFVLKIMPGAEGKSTAIITFQDGVDAWVIEVRAVDIDAALALATEYANFILDQDVDDEEVTFNEDGSSTGGVFDRMPAEGDEIPGGLKVIEDYNFMDQG